MSGTTWSTRWQQFRTLPSAVQVLAWVLVGAVAFVLVYDYVWALGRHWHDQADAIERQVSEAGDKAQRTMKARSLESAIVALGPVELPDNLAQSQEALTSVASSVVLKYRSVADYRFDMKGAATMPEVLRGVMPGKKIERISGEMRFDASVEDAIAIIAELESRPEIEAVTTVRMIRQPAIKKLRVNLTVDAWVVSDGAPRRGVATSV